MGEMGLLLICRNTNTKWKNPGPHKVFFAQLLLSAKRNMSWHVFTLFGSRDKSCENANQMKMQQSINFTPELDCLPK